MSMKFDVKTGPVRLSGYALKLRRVINGVLRPHYTKGEVDSKQVNDSISELNTKLYNILVDKYKIPKDAIVNINLSFEVVDNKVKVLDISADVYDRDEILSRNVTEELKSLF